jgi:hypothetical protein
MICHLEFVTNVVFCKDSSKERKIVGFGCTECVRKLLCFGVFLGDFFFVYMASNVPN